MKIKTEKFEIYVEGGQIYTVGGKYLRPLTEQQIDYLLNTKFNSKIKKRKLDILIENDFEEIPNDGLSLEEARAKLGLPENMDEGETVNRCNHSFRFIEKSDSYYRFFCIHCLFIRSIEL